jgi:hypothetical protein
MDHHLINSILKEQSKIISSFLLNLLIIILKKRVREAKAIFIYSQFIELADTAIEDQNCILQSWAIKNHAPEVPQFVQLFNSTNKKHLSHVGMTFFRKYFFY